MKLISKYPISFILLFLVWCCTFTSVHAQVQFSTHPAIGYDAMVNRIAEEGSVGVIVGLRIPDFQDETRLSESGVAAQRAGIAQYQTSLVDQLTGFNAEIGHRYVTIPYVSMRVDRTALDFLAAHADVTAIDMDIKARPGMAESVALVTGSGASWANGCTGNGYEVAIIDTGVDRTQAAFGGGAQVVSEACYTCSGGACPAGQASLCAAGNGSTSVGSAADCSNKFACPHGTQIAAMAAANGGGYTGVARDADIIAISVATEFTTSAGCNNIGAWTPCAFMNLADIVAGVDRVNVLAATRNIAAVNLSIEMNLPPNGIGPFTSVSACESAVASSLKNAITSLVNKNIAVVAMAGNSGNPSAIAAPGCLSNVISVGSVGDGSGGTTVNAISSFSNRASFMDFWAPGEFINAPFPPLSGNAVEFNAGTSFATPHVTASFVALKSKFPGATVKSMYDALANTGLDISGKPRIAVNAACDALIELNATVALHGAYDTGGAKQQGGSIMRTERNVPSSQPYNNAVYDGSPLDYDEVETAFNGVPGDIVDWILVELRTGTAANTTVATRAALLKSDGTVVDTDGVNPLTFGGLTGSSYHVVIRHANHLAIISKNPVAVVSDAMTINFTSAATTVLGDDMINLGGGIFGMYGGDSNFNGEVRYVGANRDQLPLINDLGGIGNLANIVVGYLNGDMNMNGSVQYIGADRDQLKIIETLGGVSNLTNLKTSNVPEN